MKEATYIELHRPEVLKIIIEVASTPDDPFED